jgi:hypothetical protein
MNRDWLINCQHNSLYDSQYRCCADMKIKLMLYYLREDMHALLVYIKFGRFQDIDGKLRVLSYMVVASCLHTCTHPRHFTDRKALWDTYHKFEHGIPPNEPRRILLNYRGKYEFETKKYIQRFYETCNSIISNLKNF